MGGSGSHVGRSWMVVAIDIPGECWMIIATQLEGDIPLTFGCLVSVYRMIWIILADNLEQYHHYRLERTKQLSLLCILR
jgi:hypothetical protein